MCGGKGYLLLGGEFFYLREYRPLGCVGSPTDRSSTILGIGLLPPSLPPLKDIGTSASLLGGA